MRDIVSMVELKPAYVNRFGDGSGRVMRSEYKPNCFIYQSLAKRPNEIFPDEITLVPTISFLYDQEGRVAAEWEPQYGPIQIWHSCEETWEDGHVKARPHWHYPFVQNRPGNWSQLAVEREGLKYYAHELNLDGLFVVLMRWAQSHDDQWQTEGQRLADAEGK